MDLSRATSENVCVISILQNKTRFLSSWHEKVGKVLERKANSKATERFVRSQ